MTRKELLMAPASSTNTLYTAQQHSDHAVFKIHTHVYHHEKTCTAPFHYFSVTARHWLLYIRTPSSFLQYH